MWHGHMGLTHTHTLSHTHVCDEHMTHAKNNVYIPNNSIRTVLYRINERVDEKQCAREKKISSIL